MDKMARRQRMAAMALLGLLVGTLALASMAEARAGGGRSSGSRGSRSFSAPRAPQSPATPRSNDSLSTTPRTSPAAPSPFRPGGFLGGLGGMLGGFVLGGLLGSLLFGGFGGGLPGTGLLDLILLGGLAFLAISYFRRRQATPAMAGGGVSPWGPTSGSAYSGREPAPEPVRPGPGAATATADPDAEDRERGVEAIRVLDPSFDPRAFALRARDVFVGVQVAWNARDIGPVRGDLTDELSATLEADIARLRSERRLNRLERLEVTSAEVTEAWEERGRDFVTVRLAARGLDYTLDEASGSVVAGSQTEPTTFEEFWTFTREVGPNPWRVAAIQQPAA
jgi:predicted lipid-binding transport protein (Tim44 family)